MSIRGVGSRCGRQLEGLDMFDDFHDWLLGDAEMFLMYSNDY